VVCDQRPGMGEKVPYGTEVFVSISMGEQTDKMPSLVAYSAENANSLLKALQIQLTVLTDREYSDDVEEGYVTRTDPEAGTELRNGQVVTVYISMGPEIKTVKVPNVVGASLDNAKASITAKNLKISHSEDYSDKVAAGYVISQSPEAGTEVEENTTVKVVVSKGKQTVTVPNVTGLSVAGATSNLEKLNLKAQTREEYNSYVPAGQVIRQSPEADTEVMPGSTVTLTVSLGPQPVPSSETEPPPSSSETEPPEPSSEDIEPSSSDESNAP